VVILPLNTRGFLFVENNLMEYRTHQWGLPDKRELLWLETAMICASCLHRWIACRPMGSDFNRLE